MGFESVCTRLIYCLPLFLQMQYYRVIIFLAGLLFSGVAEGSDEVKHETIYSYNEDYEDSKGLLYDDFEGNLTAAYDQLSKVCVITNFTFTYIKGVLNVIFIPCFVGGNYKVILRTKDYYQPAKLVPNAEHKASVTYDDIFEGPYYVIRIICDRVAQHFQSDLFVLDAYRTEELDCRFWNISISLSAIPNWHRITVVFAPTTEYKLCFKNYTVELFRFDEKCQQKERSLNKETAHYNTTNVTVTFEDLSPGNYCAAVSASHQNCLEETCGKKRTSQSIELSEPEINPVHPNNEKVDLIAIIVPLCMLAVVSIILAAVSIIGARRMKNCLKHHRSTSGNEETVTVAMLSAQCIELQSKVDLAICDFLKECCKVHPVIAEKNPEVLRNSSAWIQKYFNYDQLLNKRVIHKVLIVETDAAVRLYDHHWNLDKDHRVGLIYRKDSHLNDIFPRGLAQLLSDPESCGSDHYRIMVICFPYSTTALSCFKQKRFCLPHQTVELFNSLWNEENLLYDEENLKNSWKENETYKRLIATIEKMENYVRNNPNYLDNEVFEHTETV